MYILILFVVLKLCLPPNFSLLLHLCGSLNTGLPAAPSAFQAYCFARALHLALP